MMTSATPDALNLLLLVQEKDNQILALQHQIKRLPEREEIQTKEEEKSALLNQIETVQSELHENERVQKRLEDEVATLEDRIQGQQNKLYSGDIKAIKELQALETDIQGLKERQMLVEDQIIEVMELNEPIIERIKELENTKTGLEGTITELQKSLMQSEKELEALTTHAEEERDELTKGVQEELLGIYDNIRRQPGRVGIALLSGSTCRGCHLDLPAVEVDRIKKLPNDTVINCEECGCILVR
tara:strand:- start:213 stop:944 length:732 start_codon:yes stop_codon:yes gene_type:complete